MVNLAIQVLTLLSGLLVNFLVPAVYGLTEYGAFLKLNILVFFFHKLTDIANEPLISEVESHQILPVSFLIGLLVLASFVAVNRVFPIGNPWLLGAMLLSSSALLSMYAMRLQGWILAYLMVFLCTFAVLLGFQRRYGLGLGVEGVLLWTNAVPALLALVLLVTKGAKIPTFSDGVVILKGISKSLPRLLSLTLVLNLFTNILPFVLSKTLPLRDLGLFRVEASLLQSATSFFPVNTKAIFASFVQDESREKRYGLIMGSSLFYFSLLGFFALVAGMMFPALKPYIALVCSLPAFYWAVVSERFMLATGQRQQVMVSNWLVGIPVTATMFFVSGINQAVLLFSVGISIYLVVLQLLSKVKLPPYVFLWVAVPAPLITSVLGGGLVFGLIYLALSMVLAWYAFRIHLPTLRHLRGMA